MGDDEAHDGVTCNFVGASWGHPGVEAEDAQFEDAQNECDNDDERVDDLVQPCQLWLTSSQRLRSP